MATAFEANLAEHNQFEAGACLEMNVLGFDVLSACYHEVFGALLTERLKAIDSATAWYIRGRADRVAIHRQLPLVFEMEFKSRRGTTDGLMLPLVQFLHHVAQSALGVRCLYAADVNGKRVGFWANSAIPACWVAIPRKWGADQATWMYRMTKTYFPKITFQRGDYNGSNNPFIVIDKEDVVKMPDWVGLVEAEIAKAQLGYIFP